jgi:SPP1 gp7 family putative phage head morphogenesis protein
MGSTPTALKGLSAKDQARVVKAAQRFGKRPKANRRLRPIQLPLSAENRYALQLRKIALDVSRKVAAAFKPLLAKWAEEEASKRQDAVAKGPATKELKSTISRLRKQLRVDEKPAARMADEINQLHIDTLNKLVSPVTASIPLWRGTSLADKAVLSSAMKENVQLIKSIPSQLLDETEELISEHLADGARVETIANALQSRFEIAQRRAETIARTESSKLAAQLTEQRATSVGIDYYIWSTSLDARVRDSHKAMEGTHQRFDDPPTPPGEDEAVNPGEAFNCRCTALPDVTGLLDELGV